MKKLGWVERRDRMEKVYPDLLEACKMAFNNLSGHPEFWKTRGELPSIGRSLEQAISKAEGSLTWNQNHGMKTE